MFGHVLMDRKEHVFGAYSQQNQRCRREDIHLLLKLNGSVGGSAGSDAPAHTSSHPDGLRASLKIRLFHPHSTSSHLSVRPSSPTLHQVCFHSVCVSLLVPGTLLRRPRWGSNPCLYYSLSATNVCLACIVRFIDSI